MIKEILKTLKRLTKIPLVLASVCGIMIGSMALFDNDEGTLLRKISLGFFVGLFIFATTFFWSYTAVILIYIIGKIFKFDIFEKNLNLYYTNVFKNATYHPVQPMIHKNTITNEELIALISRVKEVLTPTARPVIKIRTIREPKPTIWQSKFGGNPYFPTGKDYPKTDTGVPLNFLAQINLSELPQNDLLPKTGMLQFYVSGGWEIGMKFDKALKQNVISDLFKVIYFPNVITDYSKILSDFTFIPKSENLPTYGNEFALTFETGEETMSLADYRISSILSESDVDLMYNNYELLQPHFPNQLFGQGHKLFGYPYFTQWDPRDRLKKADSQSEEYELLFQMDSEMPKNIMWGDLGVGNFFIRKSDLLKKDFSNVLYNWDCS